MKLQHCIVAGAASLLAAALTWSAASTVDAQVSGDYAMAVVLLNFDDGKNVTDSPAKYKETMFTGVKSANAYYQEVSSGDVHLVGVDDPTGDVYGPITVHYDGTCNFRGWANQAKAALPNLHPERYDYISYAFPRVAQGVCDWGALADLETQQIFLHDSPFYGYPVHELGHHFGLGHPNSYSCASSATGLVTYKAVFPGSVCEAIEENDPYDAMFTNVPLNTAYHFHALHKMQLGFLPSENTLTASMPGSYTILPAEQPLAGPQMLKIPFLQPDASTGYSFYFVELRRSFGTFDNFSSAPTDRVFVRMAGSPYRASALLDATVSAPQNILDPNMPVGSTIYLNAAGVALTLTSINSTGAVLQLQAISDDHAPPGYSFSGQVLNSYTFQINLTTTERAYTMVEYGPTTSYGSRQEFDAATGSVARRLVNLTHGTTYYYRLTAIDEFGNKTTSTTDSFSTPVDSTAPTIQNLQPFSVSANTAAIRWTTNENATCDLELGTTTNYGLELTRGPGSDFNVSAILTAPAGTTYHYRVAARDPAGNVTISPDMTFTTPDTVGPVINNLRVYYLDAITVSLAWTTNESTTCDLELGTTTSYGTTITRGPGSDFLVSKFGLQANTTYHYRVLARDASGNVTTSSDHTFTTPADSTAPQINNLRTTQVYRINAQIAWTTSEAATCDLEYGTSINYGTKVTRGPGSDFLQNPFGLTPGTVYHYRVVARDAAGNTRISPDKTFTTLP
jgi:hypothetical protein